MVRPFINYEGVIRALKIPNLRIKTFAKNLKFFNQKFGVIVAKRRNYLWDNLEK